MRNSQTHPLEITAISPGGTLGRIGITFCPGQKDRAPGGWDRDLWHDVQAIRDWGASMVLTLMEAPELARLGVPELGDAVRQAGLAWLHLPIPDLATPDAAFEAGWHSHGASVRDRLRAGESLVLHCRAGLGRSGMVAARLLVELGMAPQEAIGLVRRHRPGAIETPAQEAHVLACRTIPPGLPAAPRPGMAEDRAIGALLGLAAGDAVGTTLEFTTRDSRPPLTDMVGGGPFRLKAGEWTDDTAMALALADSLLRCGELREQDLLARFTAWHEQGEYSCTGTCFDIGITTAQALARWKRSGADHCGATAPDTAGNGSLMRLAPVALRFHKDPAGLRDAAVRQSRTTHAAPEAVDACIAFAELLAEAIAGAPKQALLRPRPGPWAGAVGQVMGGSWRGKARRQVASSGYVVHSLEAALWCLDQTEDFREAVLLAANLGHDADTTAAITGQLAGAIHGASGIPPAWRQKLAWGDRIQAVARELFAAAG